MKNLNKKPIDIIGVIKSRLAYQSTQDMLLKEFQIKNCSFDNIMSSSIIERVRLWDEDQRKKFYSIVGGANYINLTKSFFQERLKIINISANHKSSIKTL